MPPAGSNGTPAVGIELERPPLGYFCPGDVLIGRITRSAFIVSPRTRVSIRLYGRAKVKIVERRQSGNSTTHHYYRGRWNFWGAETTQVLFDGPMHIPREGGQPLHWSFAVPLPRHANPNVLLQDNSVQDASFLPMAPAAIAAEVIPPSFFATGRQYNKRFDAYVEYYVQAEIFDKKAEQATFPIKVIPPAGPDPIADLRLGTTGQAATVRTPRLVPGQEEVKVSFMDRTRAFFHSDKVPTLGFAVQVTLPGVIQMDHPGHIPFLVRVLVDRFRTTGSIVDVPHKIVVHELKIWLGALTEVRARGLISTHHAQDEDKMMFGPPLAERSLPGLVLPVGENAEPVDLGAITDMHFTSGAAVMVYGKPYLLNPSGVACPTFNTYPMRVAHHLSWEMKIECAGEVEKVSGGQPLLVLPPPMQQVMTQRSAGPVDEGESSRPPEYEKGGFQGEAPPYEKKGDGK